MIKAIKRRGADIKVGTIYMPITNGFDWFRCTTTCTPPRTDTLKGKFIGRRGKGEGRGDNRNVFYNCTPVYIRTS